MWHEARKQERKIRGMLVDYKKRAERRREYYEKIKQDPTQFIQIHGRACKIHLDPSVHYAAEAPGSMMQWRGDRESMIDRFDVRAHLDDIPSYDPHSSVGTNPEEVWEERQANYERYRILVQNEFLGIKEEKFLNQIRMEELYGPVGSRAADEEKKALMPKKAAIGFIYDEPSNLNYSGLTQNWNQPIPNEDEEDSGDESDSDIDLDLTVDVFSLSNQQQMDLNTSGIEYGMNKNDFMALINRDLEEAEALRVAKEHEDEKAMFSGRKSRKERRALKKKHFDKKMSPPSYAARASPTYGPYHRFSSNSRSRSNSPQLPTSQIKFITSFGDESGGSDGPDESSRVIIIPESDKTSKGGADNKKDRGTASSRKKNHPRTSSSSRERSRSKSRKRRVSRSTSRHRSRTRSPTRNRRLSRSNSRHRSRTRSPTRNRRDDYRYKSRRRSGSYGRSKRRSPSCSRSRSRSADRWRRKGSRYRSRSRSYSRSPIRSSRVSHKNEVPMPSSSKNGGNLYEQQAVNPSQKLPSPPRRRYYGRRAENSDSDLDSEDESTRTFSKGQRNEATSSYSVSNAFSFGNESNTDKGYSSSKLNPKERLRKKMQALLKKQYKMDKKLEKEKAEKAERERMDREEELREIAIKLRRRERERRHRYHDDYSGSDDSYEFRSSSRSPSRSSKSPPRKSKSRELSIERRSSERESRRCDRESSRERGKEREKSRYRRSRERSYDREDSKRSHYREESRRARNSSRRRSQSRSRNDRSSYEDDSPV